MAYVSAAATPDDLSMPTAQRAEGGVRMAHVFGDLTVGEVVGQGDVGCKVRMHYQLADVASAFKASGRTAAVVADKEGQELEGLLTENDVLRAYFQGATPEDRVSDWLEQQAARAPMPKLGRLTVDPATKLEDVANQMVENALHGDCACHHVVVKDEDDNVSAVLSSYDMVKALCRPEILKLLRHGGHPSTDTFDPSLVAEDTQAAAARELVHLTVEDVMKPREWVVTCPPYQRMRDAVKLLLMTQQNSVLIVDPSGVQGIITPRDVVSAFIDNVPNGTEIAEWLRTNQPGGISERTISADSRLVEAAATLSQKHFHHLVVVRPGTEEAVGIISDLDIVQCNTPHAPMLRRPAAAGPYISEVMEQSWHRKEIFEAGATFREIAHRLAKNSGTSALLAMREGGNLTLVTETDLLMAFLAQFSADSPMEDWLAQGEEKPTVPLHLVLPPAAPLADAASMMLAACSEARHPVHHLVVQEDANGECMGVLSALDIAKGITIMSTELDLARMGADSTTVAMVMKPINIIPKCNQNDSIREALQSMVASGQHAALVVDESGLPCLDGIITPRCVTQALASEMSQETTVAGWLRTRWTGHEGPREVPPTMKLYDAALLMSKHNLHHLVVANRPYVTTPVGIISSLDLVRGVASINIRSPFTSLAWLRAGSGPHSCDVKRRRLS
eukprot:TRINITY_DN9316_c0_g1_i1.p1 TRINITY_DN9316_c0_g1~~TRINITY_DN9316_c0_g1_i1.p1  ORF type:complete len:676 (-),score=171.82 TRINITY_DN9316_c0_g1_i1:267-2294(-)